MTLADYLSGNGGIVPLAHKTGLSRLTIASVRDGKSCQTRVLWIISDATGGQVSVSELVGASQPANASRSQKARSKSTTGRAHSKRQARSKVARVAATPSST